MNLQCAWLYFEVRYLSRRGVRQESSWNPSLHPPTLCLIGEGVFMKDCSLLKRHAEHLQDAQEETEIISAEIKAENALKNLNFF